jgi:hypothetical protein
LLTRVSGKLNESDFDLWMPTDPLDPVRPKGLANVVGGPASNANQQVITMRAASSNGSLDQVAE